MRSLRGHLSLWLLSAALLGPSAAFSGHKHKVDGSCESDVLPIQGMIKLLEAGLKTGDLKLEDLRAYSQLPKLRNPYSNSAKTVGNHAYRTRYARLLRKLPETHLEGLRARVLELVRRHSEQAAKVDAAEAKTAHIVRIEVAENLDWLQSIGALEEGTLEGRPIRVGYFRTSKGQVSLMIIDPTNKVRDNRFVPFGPEMASNKLPLQTGRIFQFGRRDYFLDFRDFKVYALATGREAHFSRHFPGETPQGLKLEGALAFPIQNNFRLITSWHSQTDASDADSNGIMKFADLRGENRIPKELFRGRSTALREMKTFEVNGRVILSYPPSGAQEVLRFIDVTEEPFIIAEFSFQSGFRSYISNHTPLPFASNEGPRALIRYQDGQTAKYHLGIFDLGSRTLMKSLNVGTHDPAFMSSTSYVEMEGNPFAIVSFSHGNLLLDLTAFESVWTIENSAPLDFSIYEWAGEKYLAGIRSPGSELQILDLATGTVRARKEIDGISNQRIFSFIDNGRPRAILFGNGKSKMVNLTAEEEKK